MSFGWCLQRDSGYLASLQKPYTPPNVVSGSLVYVAGYSSTSYNGAGVTWNDISGNGNNMTISGATWSSPNKAFSFNGTNNYIYTPNIYSQLTASNANFSQTQEVWFKSGNAGQIVQEANAISSASWYDSQLELTTATTLKMRYWNLSSPYVTAGTNDSTRWNYVALRYNGATTTIDGNFNGTFVTAQTFTRELAPSPANIYYILGQATATNMGSGTSAFFNGLIAVYRTYKRALSNAEILQNWNAEKGFYGY